MQFFIDKIYPYRWIIVTVSSIILFLGVLVEGALLVLNYPKEVAADITLTESTENIQEELTEYQIDIKGAVKKPGVYKLSKDTLIHEAIETAGGLKYGGTTKNINLSKKISNEMVLYIYTNSELEKEIPEVTCPECVCETVDISSCTEDKNSVITTSPTTEEKQEITNNASKKEEEKPSIEDNTSIANRKININEASKEELTALKGIGEKIAEKIISYRNEHGKFIKIEDITNVSGIGASIFEKIKEDITI